MKRSLLITLIRFTSVAVFGFGAILSAQIFGPGKQNVPGPSVTLDASRTNLYAVDGYGNTVSKMHTVYWRVVHLTASSRRWRATGRKAIPGTADLLPMPNCMWTPGSTCLTVSLFPA